MNIATQDNLSTRHENGLGKIEMDMASRYGERYLTYRKHYLEAGRFEYCPPFPLYLMLEQTYCCNLKCPSCIHGLPDKKKEYNIDEKVMPFDLYKRVILEGEESGCPSVSMHSNDEPLLVKDLAGRVAFAKEHGFMDIFITTNGNLLNRSAVKSLIDAGVTQFLFSIDAATSETYNKARPGGDFDKVVNIIEYVNEYKLKNDLVLPCVRASFVSSSLNIHEIEMFNEKFNNLVDYVEIQPLSTYYDLNVNLVPSTAKHVEDFRCSELWRKLIIRANGDVLPCCSYYGYEIVVGNVNKTSIRDIFHSALCSELRDGFKKGAYSLPTCVTCSKSFYK